MTSLCRLLRAAVLLSWWAITAAAVVVPAPGPTQPNVAKNCNKWYLVAKTGDDCSKATAAAGITLADFLLWNPDVSKDCTVNFWPDYYYCVGIDPNAPTTTRTSRATTSMTSTTTPRTSTTTANISTTTSQQSTATVNATYSFNFPVSTWNITTPTRGTVFPPLETKAGQPSYCIDWHYADGSDTCLTITNRYGMQVDDLLDWNPSLGDDCSGLAIHYWLCIRIQPQTSLTLTFANATGSISVPAGTPWTTTTWPSVGTEFTASPTQGPLPTNCMNYYQAANGDRCTNILTQFAPLGLTQEQFFAWNPFLNGNCEGLWSGYFYCVFAGSNNQLPDPPTATTKPAAGDLAPGVTSTCVRWYRTSGGDTCDLVVSYFGRFSLANFVSWNPSVNGTACTDIKDDLYYCVGVPGTSTTRTAAIPPFPTGTDDGPTSTAPAATSPSTTSRMSITSPTPTTTSQRPSTTSSSTAGATPSPIQPGMINGCKRFYQVVGGDGCWAISNAAGIQLSDFYKWNTGIDSVNCSNLWPGYYVCVGI